MFRLATAFALGALAVAAHAGTLKVPQQFQSIQVAVDAASPGDKILIAPGTYVEVVRVPAGLHGLTLQGAGKGVILDGRPLGSTGSGDALGIDASDDVTICNLVVRNAKFKSGGGTFDAGRGIHSIGAGTFLDKCGAINCNTGGIRLTGTGARAQNCESQGNAIGYEVTGADAELTRCAVLQAAQAGFLVTADGVTLAKCRVSNTAYHGILVNGDFARVTGCVLISAGQGDSFSGGYAGIEVTGDGNSVMKNELRGCGKGIIAFGDSGTVISGNELYGIGSYAIQTFGSDFVVEKNQIRGGSTKSYEPALFIASSGTWVRANTIRDVGSDALAVFGDDVEVEANRVFDASTTGIFIAASAANTLLAGNETHDCALMGLRNDGTGTSATGNSFAGSLLDVGSSQAFLEFSANSFATGGEDEAPILN